MAAPTITGIVDSQGPAPMQGGHFCVHAGTFVAQGTTGWDPENEGAEIAITASIVRDPGDPLSQVIPAHDITYGSTDSQGNRNVTATFNNYTSTGGGQELRFRQATSPFEVAAVQVNIK